MSELATSMTSDTHTPGPWVAQTQLGMAWVRAGASDQVAECWRSIEGGTMTATLDEAHANARLIAAAPKMLAALQSIACSSLTDRDSWTLELEDWRALALRYRIAARAALPGATKDV